METRDGSTSSASLQVRDSLRFGHRAYLQSWREDSLTTIGGPTLAIWHVGGKTANTDVASPAAATVDAKIRMLRLLESVLLEDAPTFPQRRDIYPPSSAVVQDRPPSSSADYLKSFSHGWATVRSETSRIPLLTIPSSGTGLRHCRILKIARPSPV